MNSPHRPRRSLSLVAGAFLVGVAWSASLVAVPADDWSALRTGDEVFRAACATCHGVRGAGVEKSIRGFEVDPPDFTDCKFTSREQKNDWVGIAIEGGPLKGFSPMMPAFGKVLTRDQIEAAVTHAKGYCPERRWPPGEFNLPKALYTGKAFPEDEVAWSVKATVDEPVAIIGKFVVAMRIGARHQLEAAIEGGAQQVEVEREDGTVTRRWGEGAGDLAVAWKSVLWQHLPAGTIGSLTLDVFLPTGDEADGFSDGIFKLEPAMAIGQIIPRVGFLQLQGGVEVSTDTSRADHVVFWRAAVGRTFRRDGYRRAWSPMVEVLGETTLADAAPVDWGIAPQLQIALSARQHVRLGAGALVPINDFDTRQLELKAYLVWDWYDGGFTQGW